MVKTGRLTELDRAKGLGIFLVVLGHVTGREVPSEWYGHLKQGIYAFHMPVFFFLSGLTFGMGRLAHDGEGSWVDFVSSRARRLIPAYIGVACLVFAGKWVASQFLEIHRAPVSLEDFLVVFTHPTLSFCGFLWYVYALFLALVVASAFAKIGGRWAAPAFLVFSVVLLVSYEWPFLLELRRTVGGLPWLALGWLAARHYSVFKNMVVKAWWAFGIAFFLVLVPFASSPVGTPITQLQWASISLMGIPFVYGISAIVPEQKGQLLERLGKYSFTIYLFNVLLIGLATAVFGVLLQGRFMDLQMLVMTALALGLPILLYKVVERIAPRVAPYIK